MAIKPIEGFYVHDEDTNTDGVAKVAFDGVQGLTNSTFAPTVIQGSYDRYGGVVSNSARIRTKGFIPTHRGDVLTFTKGTNAAHMLIGWFSADKTFIQDSSWYDDSLSLTFWEDGNIILVFKNDSGSAISPSEFDATVTINQIGLTGGIDNVRVSANDATNSVIDGNHFYMPTITWENNSFDSHGNPSYDTGNKRARSAELIPVVAGRTLYVSVPRYVGAYIYQYDANKSYITSYGWYEPYRDADTQTMTGTLPVSLESNTEYIGIVIRKVFEDSQQDVFGSGLHYAENTHVFQIVNDNKEHKIASVPFTVGTVEDYSDLVVNDNATSTKRAVSNLIPAAAKNLFFTVSDGYQGYVFEYGKDFLFIKERGWVKNQWYYRLDDNTEYIRFVFKNNADSEMTVFPELSVEFKDAIEKYPVNPIMLSNQLIAHRGYMAEAPENTLPAIELAHEYGFKMVEIDLQFTSDGVCVLLHDNSIDRTSDGTGNIYNMTYEQSQAYDFGSWKSEDYAGTKIPTLKEALLFCKYHNMCAQLDIADLNKTNITKENLQTMLDDIKSCGMLNNVHICCYDDRARALVSMQNGINLVVGVGSSVTDAPKLTDLSYACSMLAGSNSVEIQSDAMMEYCHRNNMPYQVWTIQNTATAISTFEKGVDWIITNSIKPSEIGQ